MKQVSKGSGNVYHFSLDPNTCRDMQAVSVYHEKSIAPVSLSTIVRRALRLYREHLEALTTEESKAREAYELLRAGRGI